MSEPVYVTDATFESEVLNSDVPVLVEFFADWCTPCKAIQPMLSDIADAAEREIAVATLNIDENPATVFRYGRGGIPTLILFKGGRPVERFSGIVSSQTVIRRSLLHLGPRDAVAG